MTYTFRVNPGYHYSGETIEITQKLTEEQFRAIEDILCRAPKPFNRTAERTVFKASISEHAERVRAYLCEQRLPHTTTLRQTFAIDDPEFQRRGRRT
jgi:hypothetical protein